MSKKKTGAGTATNGESAKADMLTNVRPVDPEAPPTPTAVLVSDLTEEVQRQINADVDEINARGEAEEKLGKKVFKKTCPKCGVKWVGAPRTAKCDCGTLFEAKPKKAKKVKVQAQAAPPKKVRTVAVPKEEGSAYKVLRELVGLLGKDGTKKLVDSL